MTTFKLKEYQKLSKPVWPKAIEFFAKAELNSIQLPKTLIGNDIELWTTIIGENPMGACKVKVLNLSNNKIGI